MLGLGGQEGTLSLKCLKGLGYQGHYAKQERWPGIGSLALYTSFHMCCVCRQMVSMFPSGV